MRYANLALGILFFLAFLLSGAYMKFYFKDIAAFVWEQTGDLGARRFTFYAVVCSLAAVVLAMLLHIPWVRAGDEYRSS